MKKIKIIRIITRLNIGGPAINAVLLSEGLDQKFFNTRLIAGSLDHAEGDMSYLAREKNIDLIIIPQLGRRIRFLNDLKAFWEIYRIIKIERPDIVHTHTAKAGLLGRLSAILAGVPVIVHTFHGHVFEGYFNNIMSTIFIGFERLLAIFTTKIITVSVSLAGDISTKYKIATDSKIEVVPLGFDLEVFFDSEKYKGLLKEELGLAGNTILIGIVGRLVPIKNHKMFIKAAKSAKDTNIYSSIKFLIIGDGELHGELKRYIKEIGLKDDVIFLGWRRDLEKIYADLDIVCLTSLNEGTPVSLIEALASARPVVSTDVGGVKDVVKDDITGRLIPRGDEIEFSKAISELLQNRSKRIEMGTAGRKFVRLNFNKGKLIENMDYLYKKLLKERGII